MNNTQLHKIADITNCRVVDQLILVLLVIFRVT